MIAADFHEAAGGKEERAVRRERISVDENLDLPTFLRREQRAGEEGKAD